MKVLVMGGRGKVGSAIAELAAERFGAVYVLDKTEKAVPAKTPMDVLHVCIPWGKTFMKDVNQVVKSYRPWLIIIHSTVPVGTTRKFGHRACHSPVRGQHDDLKGSIKRFVKYVAGALPKSGKAAQTHLQSIGISTTLWERPEETELSKLLCLSRFLNDLAFYEEAEKICRSFRVPPIRLVEWTWTYNDGYENIGNGKFKRPELTFPKGVAGGTCVMPVSKMLYDQTKSQWLGKNISKFRQGCKS